MLRGLLPLRCDAAVVVTDAAPRPSRSTAAPRRAVLHLRLLRVRGAAPVCVLTYDRRLVVLANEARVGRLLGDRDARVGSGLLELTLATRGRAAARVLLLRRRDRLLLLRRLASRLLLRRAPVPVRLGLPIPVRVVQPSLTDPIRAASTSLGILSVPFCP